MTLIEPFALLLGESAAQAVLQGEAVWLAGGPAAFALGRVVGGPTIRSIRDLPADAVARVAQAPPPWAGLPIARPSVMGVINVTPDSFSDPGAHATTARAVAAGRVMIAAGADLLDIGGDSTRPGAPATPPEVEMSRVLPVIAALAPDGVAISIDTRNAATMAAALDAGARIVNDVSALRHDPASLATVAARKCPVVLMHMRGTPATMQSLARYGDIAAEVTRELAQTLAMAEQAGISRGAIALDPGIGFAKGAGQNEEMLRRLPVLLNLGCRLVVGVSRKSFVGRLSGEAVANRRVGGSLAAGLAALLGGAAILRVHDVAETVQAVRVWQGIFGTTATSAVTSRTSS